MPLEVNIKYIVNMTSLINNHILPLKSTKYFFHEGEAGCVGAGDDFIYSEQHKNTKETETREHETGTKLG